MKAEGVTHLEAQKLLIDYAYAAGKTESYLDAREVLAEVYGVNFYKMPERAEVEAYETARKAQKASK